MLLAKRESVKMKMMSRVVINRVAKKPVTAITHNRKVSRRAA